MPVVYPDKNIAAPVLQDRKYLVVVTTQMPCGREIKGRFAAEKVDRARNRANNLCDQSVRGHLAGCKKCPSEFRRKYS